MTHRTLVAFLVMSLSVACSHETVATMPTATQLRPSPRIVDSTILDPNHKCIPVSTIFRLTIRYASLPPTKNVTQTVDPTWTDEERHENDEMLTMAFPRLVSFQTTDGDLWLTLFNQDYSKGGVNNIVFRLHPASDGWRLKAIGAFRDSDMGPSHDTWLEILGGSITLDSGSCEPSKTLRCTFELDAKFAVEMKLRGSFQYRICDDIDGLQAFLLRETDR
jgi:hypothetical protein